MADSSILVKDANGAIREVATDLVGTVHTPKNQVTGPLTDAQLRASSVPVSGPFLTDTQLRATPVPVSGPATNAELRATPLPVSGPLTNTELRATAVPVSGPLTDAALRATPVRVVAPPDVPSVGGTYSIAAATLVGIAIPAGSTSVRIVSDVKIRFGLVDAPEVPVANTLTIGGFVHPNLPRELALPAGADTVSLLTLAGSAAVVDVSFLAPI
jgi:hypothetical protein